MKNKKMSFDIPLLRLYFAEREVTIIIFATLCLLASCADKAKLWSQVGYEDDDYMSSHICDIGFTSDLGTSYAPLAFKERSFQCKGAYTILNKQVFVGY